MTIFIQLNRKPNSNFPDGPKLWLNPRNINSITSWHYGQGELGVPLEGSSIVMSDGLEWNVIQQPNTVFTIIHQMETTE